MGQGQESLDKRLKNRSLASEKTFQLRKGRDGQEQRGKQSLSTDRARRMKSPRTKASLSRLSLPRGFLEDQRRAKRVLCRQLESILKRKEAVGEFFAWRKRERKATSSKKQVEKRRIRVSST